MNSGLKHICMSGFQPGRVQGSCGDTLARSNHLAFLKLSFLRLGILRLFGVVRVGKTLAFSSQDTCSPPLCGISSDPWDRDVEFEPSALPYDPRDFLRGVMDLEENGIESNPSAGLWEGLWRFHFFDWGEGGKLCVFFGEEMV